MKQFLIDLKPLRIALIICALLTIVLQPEPGTSPVYHGREMVSTLLVPVLAPLFFMLMMLDSLIATLWHSQTAGEEQQRYRRIRNTDLIIGGLLLLSWLPYFIALVN
ncbi:hypothetical protein [Thiohalophilus thiocyanatoxydans]|uniref:Uncharacterized protein n=1 Tax=Thiohalophilus thiocyanatoxydans TaxID=381308 RepID=A0A4R8IKS9_9GAMM|nr:hypothetical protein [Thiohalophilus thiocyanatoxydans]TDY00978.1 hypothetical protein EDC23_1724 [Thiohalophilus thiocyanatoxydans]